jgi:hypothetical protein
VRNPSLRVGARAPARALPIAFGVVLGAVAYFVFDADVLIAVAFPVVAALVVNVWGVGYRLVAES